MVKKILVFVGIIGLLTFCGVFAQQDSLCTVVTDPGTCILLEESTTVQVPYDAFLFGRGVGFCLQVWLTPPVDTLGPAQIIICIDRSNSMHDCNYGCADPDDIRIAVAQQFVDSIAARSRESKIGVVLFPGLSGTGSNATGWPLLDLSSYANIDTIKEHIAQGATTGPYTPYGAALDTCAAYFDALSDADSNRHIIFFSDGWPMTPAGDPDPRFEDIMNNGEISNFPPIHTVYLWGATAGYDASLAAVIEEISDSTGGTYSDIGNPDGLWAPFDTLLNNAVMGPVIEKIQLETVNFFIENTTTAERVAGTSNGSIYSPYVSFSPLYLQPDTNRIEISYDHIFMYIDTPYVGCTLIDTVNQTKAFWIQRLAQGQPAPSHPILELICEAKSRTSFTDTAWEAIVDGDGYVDGCDSVRIRVIRGPDEKSVDSVIVTNQNGDLEYVRIYQTDAESYEYHGVASRV